MRRVFGALLVGIAVLSIVLAILLPTFVVPNAKKTPLDLDITLRSNGTAMILNAATGKMDQHSLRATRIVRSDSAYSDSTNTTVNESLCIVIDDAPDTPDCVPSSDARLLSLTTDRVTTNRKSAEAVNDVAKYRTDVNGNPKILHEGMAYKWPIDAKKQTYKFFQPDIGKAFDAEYVGTEKLDTYKGVTLYKYVCKTGVQTTYSDGSDFLVNGTFKGTYDDTRTVWVEPKTGAIIKGEEIQTQTILPTSTDGEPTVALQATLTFDNASQKFQANFAKKKIDELKRAQVYAPIGLGIIGLLAAVGAALLLLTKGRPGSHSGDAAEPEPVGAGSGPGGIFR
jgi:hypothetical protein